MNLPIFSRRVVFTGVLVIGAALFLAYRLVSLHFSDSIYVPSDADREVHRGAVLDRSGSLLAVSVERRSLFANPSEITDPESVAGQIAPLIEMSRPAVLDRLRREKRFVWLRRKLDDGTAARIASLGIKGLYLRSEYHRVYPHGTLASNIVGFAGLDNTGLEGIEYRYDGVLTGRKGPARTSPDADYIKGCNVRLTIDRVVQYTAEREIERGVRESGALQGAAVVMEVKTGRLLAVAKYPLVDPNSYWEFPGDAMKNFAVVDSFEPGSTLKVIAAASLLETHPKVLQEKFRCEGKIEVADAVIKCTAVHGDLTLDGIIKHSCNAGIIQAVRRLRREDLHATLSRFGFGRETGVEMPGESPGLLRGVGDWSGLSRYSLSIGQEISVTSIQMVAAFGAIANGGVYMAPTVIESIESDDGTVLQAFYPKSRGRIVRQDVAARLLSMMKGVVEGGTATKARMAYYEAAGKTGTAQKSMKRGGYHPGKYMASFVGIAPLHDPDICVLVLLDEPPETVSGGGAASPVFARIAGRVLPYRGIRKGQVAAGDPLKGAVRTLHVRRGVMPDFRGMRLGEAARTLAVLRKEAMLDYSLVGRGVVRRQSPEPGSPVGHHRKIILYFEEQ
jgi:cell division protein FtsI/penicillin-binding protein 2